MVSRHNKCKHDRCQLLDSLVVRCSDQDTIEENNYHILIYLGYTTFRATVKKPKPTKATKRQSTQAKGQHKPPKANRKPPKVNRNHQKPTKARSQHKPQKANRSHESQQKPTEASKSHKPPKATSPQKAKAINKKYNIKTQ